MLLNVIKRCSRVREREGGGRVRERRDVGRSGYL